jgi:hypothetical protein
MAFEYPDALFECLQVHSKNPANDAYEQAGWTNCREWPVTSAFDLLRNYPVAELRFRSSSSLSAILISKPRRTGR